MTAVLVVPHLVWFGGGLLVMTAATVGLATWAGIRLGLVPFYALLRAALQLTVVALLLRGILEVRWTVAAFVLLMISTASWTAAGRLKMLWRGRRAALVGVVGGATVTLVLIFALQLVGLEVRYLVATAGIIIGNAMSAATLSGRNFLRSARQRREEVEGWLALGATPSRAHLDIGQDAVRESLFPNLDQTKSTGLVTLPGAFVGALFGGASPSSAAQFQLVVLAGVALAMTVTGVVVTRLVGRSPYVSIDPGGLTA